MAGDWIPMRLDLHEDPAVIQLAELQGTTEDEVVGMLLRVWAWVSRNCHAESVTNVTKMSLGRVTHTHDFCDNLVTVGWLEEIEVDGKPGIRFPHFDRYLSKTAKKRLNDAKRQQVSRSKATNVTKMSRSKRDESVTTEQNRTEHITHTHAAAAIKHLPPDVGEAWTCYLAYLWDRDGRVNDTQVDLQLMDLERRRAEQGDGYVIAALRRTIDRGSKGSIFWDELPNGRSKVPATIPEDF